MASNLYGKLVKDVEIKAPAEKFHHFFKHKPHHLPYASPDKAHGCELYEGEWGKVGSIVIWTYFHDGEKRVDKDRIEAIDDEKSLITFQVLESNHLMEHFKTFRATVQVIPKADGEGSNVHWILEYEKLHGEIIDPHTLLDFLLDVSKDLEAHLLEK